MSPPKLQVLFPPRQLPSILNQIDIPRVSSSALFDDSSNKQIFSFSQVELDLYNCECDNCSVWHAFYSRFLPYRGGFFILRFLRPPCVCASLTGRKPRRSDFLQQHRRELRRSPSELPGFLDRSRPRGRARGRARQGCLVPC